jgi:dephospho-CoA kinase
MILIGLTGGIGMGKSTAANLLRQRGLPVVDTDILARQVVEPGEPAFDEIRKAFGPDILGPDGQVRRDELARQVFSDPVRRQQLEAIVHPRIRQRWLAQVDSWRSERKPIAVVVIPLLFETNAAASFDAIICLACSTPTQRDRLLGRGWSPEQIEQRISAQWPIEKKMALSHYVVWTEGGMDLLACQIDRILSRLGGLERCDDVTI